MSNRPLISVIVPVYNASRWLPSLWEGLAKQTLREIEIIFVDDGSTDNSQEMVTRWVATCPYVCLITQPHQGLAATRATGVKESRGAYITFIDSDDCVSANYLAALYQAAQTTHAPLTIAPLVKFWKEIPTSVNLPSFFYSGELRANARVKIFEDASSAMALCGKLIARELAEQIKWQASTLQNGEDITPSVELIALAEKVAVVSGAYYFYRQHLDSHSHSAPARFRDLVEGFSQARQSLKQKGKYTIFASGFEYVCRMSLCSFMEVYPICRKDELALRAHCMDLQVPSGIFATRSLKFRIRQWLFEKSLQGYFSYSKLMRFLRRLFRRA